MDTEDSQMAHWALVTKLMNAVCELIGDDLGMRVPPQGLFAEIDARHAVLLCLAASRAIFFDVCDEVHDLT